MVSIKFRITEKNKVIYTTHGVSIHFPALVGTKHSTEHELVLKHYKEIKKAYPKAEIIVICQHQIWETFEPLSTLKKGDIIGLLKKADKTMKKGIL